MAQRKRYCQFLFFGLALALTTVILGAILLNSYGQTRTMSADIGFLKYSSITNSEGWLVPVAVIGVTNTGGVTLVRERVYDVYFEFDGAERGRLNQFPDENVIDPGVYEEVLLVLQERSNMSMRQGIRFTRSDLFARLRLRLDEHPKLLRYFPSWFRDMDLRFGRLTDSIDVSPEVLDRS